jgi:hypothetical protein
VADRQREQVPFVRPPEEFSQVFVLWQTQHGPVATRQINGNVRRVIVHRVSHEVSKASGVGEGI